MKIIRRAALGPRNFTFYPTDSGLNVAGLYLNNSTMGISNGINMSGWGVPSAVGRYISCPAFGSYVFLITGAGAFNWYGNFVNSKNITITTPFTGNITIGTFSIGTYS